MKKDADTAAPLLLSNGAGHDPIEDRLRENIRATIPSHTLVGSLGGQVRCGASYTYNMKDLRYQEAKIAEQAEKSYEHFVAAAPSKYKAGVRPPQVGKDGIGCPVTLPAGAQRFAPRSTAPPKNRGFRQKSLVDLIRAVQLAAVLAWEGHVGQHILFADVHGIGELGPAGANLIGPHRRCRLACRPTLSSFLVFSYDFKVMKFLMDCQ